MFLINAKKYFQIFYKPNKNLHSILKTNIKIKILITFLRSVLYFFELFLVKVMCFVVVEKLATNQFRNYNYLKQTTEYISLLS